MFESSSERGGYPNGLKGPPGRDGVMNRGDRLSRVWEEKRRGVDPRAGARTCSPMKGRRDVHGSPGPRDKSLGAGCVKIRGNQAGGLPDNAGGLPS